MIGPLAAGAVIHILGPRLEETHGYQALWPVLGLPIILAIPSSRASGIRRPRSLRRRVVLVAAERVLAGQRLPDEERVGDVDSLYVRGRT